MESLFSFGGARESIQILQVALGLKVGSMLGAARMLQLEAAGVCRNRNLQTEAKVAYGFFHGLVAPLVVRRDLAGSSNSSRGLGCRRS